ncbi:unnamed protein product [Phytophthora fragariaefolia]|uniref:Unnamed protein product n=1 Tax=Phytophthora fragariaefolia TaxID=1490495 RepID=A0A9W6U0V4_9STRA|nr:unnamed protein product [Phytophthora fragariaefolia]
MTKISDSDILSALKARMGLQADSQADAATTNTAFWSQLRTALTTSHGTFGLEHLYTLAKAIITGDSAAKTEGVVVVLPSPSNRGSKPVSASTNSKPEEPRKQSPSSKERVRTWPSAGPPCTEVPCSLQSKC